MSLKIKLKHTSEEKIILLLMAFLSYNIITLFVNTLVNFVIPNTMWDTAVCLGIYICIILYTVPAILKRIKTADLIAFFLVIGIVIFNLLFFVNNREYILDGFVRFFFQTFVLFFVGRSLKDFKLVINSLGKLSYLMVVLGAVYYVVIVVTGQEVANDNMSFAYYYLPFCISMLYESVQKKRVKSFLLNIAGFLTLMMCGTRGPILCWMIAFSVFVYFFSTKVRVKVVVTILIIGVGTYFMSDEFVESLSVLDNQLNEMGINNRIIDKMLDQELLESSGRDRIAEQVVNAIEKHPILGYGLYGDRVVTAGYAHNIILELFVTFGIPVGIILLVILMGKFLEVILKKIYMREYKVFIVIFFCTGFIKLFMSGSYMQEPHLFLLLGVLFTRYKGRLVNHYTKSIDSISEINERRSAMKSQV